MNSNYKYWIINPIANFVAGTAIGYTLEKSGISNIAGVDAKLALGTPIGIGLLEFILEKDERSEKIIMGSNIAGAPCFYAGSYVGRTLAKLY